MTTSRAFCCISLIVGDKSPPSCSCARDCCGAREIYRESAGDSLNLPSFSYHMHLKFGHRLQLITGVLLVCSSHEQCLRAKVIIKFIDNEYSNIATKTTWRSIRLESKPRRYMSIVWATNLCMPNSMRPLPSCSLPRACFLCT